MMPIGDVPRPGGLGANSSARSSEGARTGQSAVPLAQTMPAKPKPPPPPFPRLGGGSGGSPGVTAAPEAPAATQQARNSEQVRAILAEPVGPGHLLAPRRADARKRATERMQRAVDRYEKAAAVGVNVARENWFKKLRSAGVALISLVAAAALTATTGGAAAPILALAAVTLAVAVGDSYCAYRSLKNARARAEGVAQPYKELPMGDSAVANMAYVLLEKAGASDPKYYARHVGRAVKLGLGLGSLAAAFGLPLVGSAAIEFVEKLASQLNMLHTVAAAFHGDREADMAHVRKEIEASYDEMSRALTDIARLPAGERNSLELQAFKLLRKAATCDPVGLVRDRHIDGVTPARNFIDHFFGALDSAPARIAQAHAAAGETVARMGQSAEARIDAAADQVQDAMRQGREALQSGLESAIHLGRTAHLLLGSLRHARDIMSVEPDAEPANAAAVPIQAMA